jgi:1,4-dihydroxy-6-naphthoate synthase
MKITLAVSPDADDLFMVRALLERQLDTGPYEFVISSSPTDALNSLASGASDEEGPDVVAVSIAHYPRVADRYQLLPHGGSVGEGYGPVVVGREPATLDDLHGARLAIPGTTTTAWVVLRLLLGPHRKPEAVVVPIAPHERVFEALARHDVDFALLIHEGRLTYAERGLVQLVDLGVAWAERTGGMPLPLGGNLIRRALGPDVIRDVSGLLRASIAYALDHRDESIAWLLSRGGGALKTAEQYSQYLGYYANQRTLDYGDDGRAAIVRLLTDAADAGLLPRVGEIDFAP